jgi:hypothetical protein
MPTVADPGLQKDWARQKHGQAQPYYLLPLFRVSYYQVTIRPAVRRRRMLYN